MTNETLCMNVSACMNQTGAGKRSTHTMHRQSSYCNVWYIGTLVCIGKCRGIQ